jgi:hypothetical protein
MRGTHFSQVIKAQNKIIYTAVNVLIEAKEGRNVRKYVMTSPYKIN